MEVIKKNIVVVILMTIIILVVGISFIFADKVGDTKEGETEFNIFGKYICSSEYHKADFFIENPDKIPEITFNKGGDCNLRINYLGGIADVNCFYNLDANSIYVELDLFGTIFYGTDNTGKPYMYDKYIFNIIDDNHIIIDKGFYTVGAGDSFIKL